MVDKELSRRTLFDELASLDLSQRREVAKELRTVAETFTGVPDGRNMAHTLGLLAVTVAREGQFEGPTTPVRMEERFGTVRRMTDETPDYMTDEVPEYMADELGDHDDLLAEGRLGHVEHIGAMWRTGFVRYEPDGHSMTVRLVAEGTPQGDTAIIDLVVAEAGCGCPTGSFDQPCLS